MKVEFRDPWGNLVARIDHDFTETDGHPSPLFIIDGLDRAFSRPVIDDENQLVVYRELKTSFNAWIRRVAFPQ